MPAYIKDLCAVRAIQVNESLNWDSSYEDIEDFVFTANFR